MTYRVYLAAAYAARNALRAHAADLATFGIEVTSTWLTETQPLAASTLGAAPDRTTAQITQHALDDLTDIDNADALVVFTGDFLKPFVAADVPELKLHTGGRHIETSYALAQNKPVIVVGTPENVFHRGLCRPAATWLDAVGHILDLADEATAVAA